MGIIEYFYQKDYKIDCDNGRRYKVSDEELIFLENKFNISNNNTFSWNEIYNNIITEETVYFSNNMFDINFRDINFESNEGIKFKFNFYHGDNKYYITPEFIKELQEIFYKEQYKKEYEFILYLEDEKKWNYYQIWKLIIKFWFEWGWFLSSSYPVVSFNEEYTFNKFDFILFIAERYFWVQQNNTYENFQFKQ